MREGNRKRFGADLTASQVAARRHNSVVNALCRPDAEALSHGRSAVTDRRIGQVRSARCPRTSLTLPAATRVVGLQDQPRTETTSGAPTSINPARSKHLASRINVANGHPVMVAACSKVNDPHMRAAANSAHRRCAAPALRKGRSPDDGVISAGMRTAPALTALRTLGTVNQAVVAAARHMPSQNMSARAAGATTPAGAPRSSNRITPHLAPRR